MTESTKTTPPSQESPYPPPVVSYPPGPFNGSIYPPPGPPGAYQPFFPYPPPPDGAHTDGAQNGVPPAPYMMFAAPPPGVMYYPPHAQTQRMFYFVISVMLPLTFSRSFRLTSAQPRVSSIKSSEAQAGEDGGEYHFLSCILL